MTHILCMRCILRIQWNWKNAEIILLSKPYTKFVPENPYSKRGDWEIASNIHQKKLQI